MKKYLLTGFIFFIILFGFYISPVSARVFQKMPIVETFGSTSCGACLNFFHSMDTLYPAYVDSMVLVFYIGSLSPCDERNNYYSGFYDIGGIPWTALDGADMDHYIAESVFDNAKDIFHATPICDIGFELLYYDHDSILIEVYTDSTSLAGEWRLVGLMVEDSINHGQFNRVCRKFITAPTGSLITVTAGEAFIFSANHELEPEDDFDKFNAVFMLQSLDEPEIVNSFHTSMVPRLSFDFAVEQPKYRYMIAPGEILDISVKCTNWGLEDDTYYLELFGESTSGWEFYFPLAGESMSADLWVRAFGDSTYCIQVVAPSIGYADIFLTVRSDSIPDRIDTLHFEIFAGGENLIVCNSPTPEDSSIYKAAIESYGENYLYWDIERDGILNDLVDPGFDKVIWFCGEDTLVNIFGEMAMAIQDFLDAGGKLFLAGSGIGRVNEVSILFFRQNLGIDFEGIATDYSSVSSSGPLPFTGFEGFTEGISSAEIFEGIDSTGGRTVLRYPDGSGAAVARAQESRSVIFGFPPERINTDDFDNLMQRCLTFLNEGFAGIDNGFAFVPQSPAIMISPNPFNSSCEIIIWSESKSSSICIFDLSGKLVKEFVLSSGQNKVIWNADNISAGIYFVKISNHTPVKALLIR